MSKRKPHSGLYVRGEKWKGNAQGKPKGRMNDITLSFIRLKKMASERVDDAFKLLWDGMEKGEAWAHQIYFKELYGLPKNFDEKKVVVDTRDKDVDEQIKVLAESLSEFDEVTQGETLERMKVLNSMKNNEALNQQNEELKETRETLIEKVELIQKVVELKEREKELDE